MLNIKLYIGAHKTATTHIQSTLESSRALLTSENIMLSTPTDLRGRWLSDFISYCDQGDVSKINSLRAIAPKNGTWILAEENISGIPYDLITMSGFYQNIEQRLNCIRKIFINCRIEVFFSIRSYDTFYRSNYLEIVRNRGYIPFSDFYSESRFINNNWNDVIKMITNVMPEESITLWCYENFQKLQPFIMGGFVGQESVKSLNYNVNNITRASLSKKSLKTISLLGSMDKSDLHFTIEEINRKYPLGRKNQPFFPFNESETAEFKKRYLRTIREITNSFTNINFLHHNIS